MKTIITNKGLIIGEYLLEKEIGKGEFGIVYKGRHMLTNHIYAIKRMSKEKIDSKPKILKRLLQTEIAILKKIKHPNIIHLYDYLESGNNLY